VLRFIVKLLVKDPKERWTAEKGLEARFFRSLDDTTKMASSAAAVASTLRNIASKVDKILDVSLVTLKDNADGRPAGRDRAVGARAQAAALRAEPARPRRRCVQPGSRVHLHRGGACVPRELGAVQPGVPGAPPLRRVHCSARSALAASR
jgi:hypothetical protein